VDAIWSICRAASAAALASSAACPEALAAPGDLDPTFANVGRFGPSGDFEPAFSVELPKEGGVLLGGGDVFGDFYTVTATGFVGLLDESGAVDRAFTAGVTDTEVLDTAMQPDGKVIGVGRSRHSSFVTARATIFRLERDGSLDSSFGDDGLVVLTDVDTTSVIVDPDGKVVAAGSRGAGVMVLRLLPDGSLDQTFGDGGFFVSDHTGYGTQRILRAGDGGYRVAVNHDFSAAVDTCRVLGLRADGSIDESFGDHGYAGLDVSGDVVSCNGFAETTDGALLVAGTADSNAFVIRLLQAGTPDATFDAAAPASDMTQATALGTGPGDSIVVAGLGAEGTTGVLVERLHADGSIDTGFGNSGSTWIDLPSKYDAFPEAAAVQTLADGTLLVAGGAAAFDGDGPRGAFVAKLEGDQGEDGPGVIGFLRPAINVAGGTGPAIVTVRRTGGSAGAVSVSFHTQPAAGGQFVASDPDDYSATSGRLDWAGGDASDREISVPILPAGSSPEDEESFEVALDDAQGGAGLGTRTATVTIPANGPPAGQFAVHPDATTVSEADGTVQVFVDRLYYGAGAVSVTLTPASGTATLGHDVTGNAVTFTWADGEIGTKQSSFRINDDSSQEPTENFTVALSGATGGAVIGPRSSATITITDDEVPGSNGGGRLDFLSVAWLCFMELVRRKQRRARRHNA
jgi:uncharacterized delta-60 repeat protein